MSYGICGKNYIIHALGIFDKRILVGFYSIWLGDFNYSRVSKDHNRH